MIDHELSSLGKTDLVCLWTEWLTGHMPDEETGTIERDLARPDGRIRGALESLDRTGRTAKPAVAVSTRRKQFFLSLVAASILFVLFGGSLWYTMGPLWGPASPVQVKQQAQDSGKPIGDLNQTVANTSSTSPLKVESFQISHYDSTGQLLGTFGTLFRSARLNDYVKIEARLSAPAYCYLIALNPNGTIQLCPRADEHTPPRLTDRIDNLGYRLTDGVGLQAFTLVASRTPLPAFDVWASRAGITWKPVSENSGAWSVARGELAFLGQSIRRTEVDAPITPMTPAPLQALHDLLDKRSDLDTFSVSAIPVHSPDAQPPASIPRKKLEGNSKGTGPRPEEK